MTVEMEQPFVWPEAPENMKPWGAGEKDREVKQTAETNGIVTPEKMKERAQKLREQVKALLMKKESLIPKAIAQKRAEGKPLTPAELLQEEAAQKKKQEIEKMSALRFWEEKRTGKVVTTDESSQFAIKA